MHEFNQANLNKLLKKQKKNRFLYIPEKGYVDGYCLISDHHQLREFLKNELLSDGSSNIMYGFQEPVKIDFQEIITRYDNQDLQIAEVTNFLHRDDLNPRVSSRVMKTSTMNFLIDDKYMQLITNSRSKSLKFLTHNGLQLLVKDKDDKTIALFMGIRSDSIFKKGVKNIN